MSSRMLRDLTLPTRFHLPPENVLGLTGVQLSEFLNIYIKTSNGENWVLKYPISFFDNMSDWPLTWLKLKKIM